MAAKKNTEIQKKSIIKMDFNSNCYTVVCVLKNIFYLKELLAIVFRFVFNFFASVLAAELMINLCCSEWRRPRQTITIAFAGTPSTQDPGTCLCPSRLYISAVYLLRATDPPGYPVPLAPWLRRMSCFSFLVSRTYNTALALWLPPQIIALPRASSLCRRL